MSERCRDVVARIWRCGADLIARWCTRYIANVTTRATIMHQREFDDLNNTLDGILGDDARIARECDRDGKRLIEHHVNQLVSNHNHRVTIFYNLGFNRLFEWSSRVSSPFVPRVEVGRHMTISGDEFLQVPVGTYVHLRREQRVSVVDDDSADEFISVYAQGVAMNGVSDYAIDNNIRRVVPTEAGDSQSVHIGRLRSVNVEYDGYDTVDYDGVVALIWERYMDRDESSDDEEGYDEDDDSRVLYYDAVIVGSSQVFQYAEWDRLYYPMSEWVRNGRDVPGLSGWVEEFNRGEFPGVHVR